MVPVQVEPLPPSIPVPVIVKSNQKRYPIELRLHVLFGRVIGGTLRSHPNELWVDHHGLVHVFSDARGLAVTRGAHASEPSYCKKINKRRALLIATHHQALARHRA